MANSFRRLAQVSGLSPQPGTEVQHRRPKLLPLIALVAICSGPVIPATSARSAPHPGLVSPVEAIRATILEQDDNSGDSTEIAPDQVEKYIAVYASMQRNRRLTIDAAVSQQGLTVEQFRALEAKIERNDASREHVRTALQAAARAQQ